MSDKAKAREGYDSVGDPRTGRPPLAIDAEKVRAEAEQRATLNESVPDGETASDPLAESPEDTESSDGEPGGTSLLDELAEEVTGEAIDAPAMLPSVKRSY
jgi:hypothetical protein